nr:UDP-N-acetylmuramoyl-L-alanyl-D-glutamate--2,6-diaminopimelate ligase [Acidimicrobium ferrooxidans]
MGSASLAEEPREEEARAVVLTLRDLHGLVPSARLVGDPSVAIADITLDSRSVSPGAMFCATRGSRFDGHDFVSDAIARGAVALLVQHEVALDIPQLVVPSVRHAIGGLVAGFFGRPSERLDLVGITGTNGKTTTSYFIDSILSLAGRRTGLIGTIEARFGDSNRPSMFTTPEAPELHRLLRQMVDDGVDSVVMEVSSHGIDQHRIDGTSFRIGVFTNLSPEHLDYHGTIEQYYAAKAQLFLPERTKQAVIGTDTEWGVRLATQVRIPAVTYGPAPFSDYRVEDVRYDEYGTIFTVVVGGRRRWRLRVPIYGIHNAYNAAAAVAVAEALGIEGDTIERGLAECHQVAGRFQRIDAGQPFTVVVDYAHTPDSLRALIATARALSPKGRVILVAGARGRRDRLKRPELGRAAATADVAILTADNPGDEDPGEIVAQLLAGTLDVDHKQIIVELDRRGAIGHAIEIAEESDVVLIVGRGHEQTFRVGQTVYRLDDREAAREAILAKLAR